MKPFITKLQTNRRYKVVISGEAVAATGQRLSSCGVGIGSDRESALANAKRDLASRLPQWSEYLNSYSIIDEGEIYG